MLHTLHINRGRLITLIHVAKEGRLGSLEDDMEGTIYPTSEGWPSIPQVKDDHAIILTRHVNSGILADASMTSGHAFWRKVGHKLLELLGGFRMAHHLSSSSSIAGGDFWYCRQVSCPCSAFCSEML
ncbi:hypothetical protein C1H46_019478 [Malus baccata]|uniref:Uncharacterized protein n=1 Tax=Malus baccata TaxID=106549 RepID=A0A540M8R2_MALBA|nr:hypothetical protein C1H46_019478 [Malus baccata]